MFFDPKSDVYKKSIIYFIIEITILSQIHFRDIIIVYFHQK